MKKVYTIGETVYDIIFRDGSIVASKPGGSMLNAAVSLGRWGADVNFISEFGTDAIGNVIETFLNANKVNHACSYRYSDGRTHLAMAFLDNNNNADYTFYRIYPKRRFECCLPDFRRGDIVLFGSFFSTTHEIREQLKNLLIHARECGAFLIYDPNFRKAHLEELDEILPLIEENFRISHLVKGSCEDFALMFNTRSASETFDRIKTPLVYTSGANGVSLFTGNLTEHYPVPSIETVSTIGAGDSFNAGMAASLLDMKRFSNDISTLSSDQWRRVITKGIEFASMVCRSYENYIPSETFCSNVHSHPATGQDNGLSTAFSL